MFLFCEQNLCDFIWCLYYIYLIFFNYSRIRSTNKTRVLTSDVRNIYFASSRFLKVQNQLFFYVIVRASGQLKSCIMGFVVNVISPTFHRAVNNNSMKWSRMPRLWHMLGCDGVLSALSELFRAFAIFWGVSKSTIPKLQCPGISQKSLWTTSAHQCSLDWPQGIMFEQFLI